MYSEARRHYAIRQNLSSGSGNSSFDGPYTKFRERKGGGGYEVVDAYDEGNGEE